MATALEIREDVLASRRVAVLTLSAPEGAVNVLQRGVAATLREALESLARRADPPALVVLASRTPTSFLNGTELLLTQAVAQAADVGRLFGPLAATYDALERCPIPTLALVEGDCFGCGVELILRCRWRLAVDAPETRFYMTELDTYRMPPIYGGLERLPARVGVDAAARLLLFGARWSAAEAAAGGLVDGTLPADPDARRAALAAFLARAPASRVDRRGEPFDPGPIEAGLAALPPRERPVFSLCWEALRGRRSAAQVVDEVLTTHEPEVWRSATAAFFTQIHARVASIGTSRAYPAAPVDLRAGPDAPAAALAHVRASRWLRVGAGESGITESGFTFEGAAGRASCRIGWGGLDVVGPPGAPLLDFPGGASVELCELWSPTPLDEEAQRRWQEPLLALLQRGHEVVRSSGGEGPLGRELIERCAEWVAARVAGGELADLERSLWSFGCERTLAASLARVGRPVAGAPLERAGGRESPPLLAALLDELTRFGRRALAEGRVRHRSQINLLFRALLAYPVSRPPLFP